MPQSMLSKKNKFIEPGNTAVYTTTHVMREGSTITLVSHDLDGDWQFMGNETIEDLTKMGMLVALDEVIKIDASILQVSDLPIGHQATRRKLGDSWEVEKIDYSESEIEEMGYYCAECGVYHREIPMNYGAKAPTAYFNLADEEKAKAELTQDICIIGDKRFFIKGQIQIKVEGKSDPFSWNVWVEVSENDFVGEQENWNDENRFLRAPYPGILNTPLNVYPSTLGLQVHVQTQPIGLIPTVRLLPSNHPLFLEQESGINMKRVIEFAREILYDH